MVAVASVPIASAGLLCPAYRERIAPVKQIG
jgi:hypothetical protein